MGGRPKKPVALKKLQGTFRADRDSENSKNTQILERILPVSKLTVPRTIRQGAVRKAYKRHIALLRAIGAELAADSPLLEMAYRSLGEALRILDTLEDTPVSSATYINLQKAYTKHLQEFDRIARAFYLTPAQRAHLKLDVLSAREKELSIQKEQTVVEKLLSKKES